MSAKNAQPQIILLFNPSTQKANNLLSSKVSKRNYHMNEDVFKSICSFPPLVLLRGGRHQASPVFQGPLFSVPQKGHTFPPPEVICGHMIVLGQCSLRGSDLLFSGESLKSWYMIHYGLWLCYSDCGATFIWWHPKVVEPLSV